jgi:hypothetical protein
MRWLVFILRRFIAPALLAGFVANIVLYWVLETEGGLTDWRSIAMLAAMALTGFIVAATGAALGAIGMALIVVYWVEADDAFGFNHLGIPTGVAAALAWLCVNFDLLRAADRRGKIG